MARNSHETPADLGSERAPKPALGPGLDSVEDELMRQRIHARLFASERAGVWIDRFELLTKLGSGGMGTVWAAKDHRLQRKVALKFLRGAGAGGVGEERLFREAQALARLSHPNVVGAFDVGRHEGRVWIAMELIEGQTLHEWVEAGEHHAEEVLRAWLDAGRGLAAIHAAGLVHRDIKPSNVLVGSDGVVRVVDFGLVRAVGAEPEAEPTLQRAPDSTPSEDMVERLMTESAHFVGTPAYAPPEQRAGAKVDTRADQYSFCVSVWESLTGERPSVERKPEASVLAPRVRTALLRGLESEPERRFASMPELLDALEPPSRAWVVPSVLGGALVVAVGLGLFGSFGREQAAASPCTNAGQAIEEQWNASVAEQLGRRLGESPALAERVEAGAEQWVERWQASAHQACEQVHVQGLASAESLDRRGRCLDEQRRLFGAVVEELGGEAVNPLEAFASLPEPGDCLLRERDPLAGLSEAALAEHRQLSERLVQLQVRRRGRSVAAREQSAAELYASAERAGLEQLQAEAAYFQGNLALLAGDADRAQRWLGEAIDRAEPLGLDGLRAKAWLRLASAEMYLELDAGRAEFVWRRAEALARGLPRPHRVAAQVEVTRGAIHLMGQELEEAEVRLDTAIEQLATLGLGGVSAHADALRLRASVATRRGQHERAKADRQRADELEAQAGLDERKEGSGLKNEGIALLEAGRLDEARETLEQARAQLEREQPRGRTMAKVHLALSGLDDAEGDYASAHDHAAAADAILRSRYGAKDPKRFEALNALGVAAFRVGDYEAAAEAYSLGLELAGDTLGPLDLAVGELNLAEAYEALGQPQRAEPLLRRSLATLEAELGPDHAELAIVHKGLGAVLLASERPAEAELELRRALALHAKHRASPVEAADSQWLLARTLAALGREHDALVEARAAAERYLALGPQSAAREAEVRSWIASRSTAKQSSSDTNPRGEQR